METYQVKTSVSFAYFFEALKCYTVELYATDYETGEPLENVDQNSLSETAQQQLFEVARQFWQLAVNHIHVFVTGAPEGVETKLHTYYGPQHGPDCEALDYFALRFASAFNGCGLLFSDTIPDTIDDKYDGHASIDTLQNMAELFYGAVSLFVSGKDDMGDPILDFDCEPQLTVRWADSSKLNRLPTVVKPTSE